MITASNLEQKVQVAVKVYYYGSTWEARR